MLPNKFRYSLGYALLPLTLLIAGCFDKNTKSPTDAENKNVSVYSSVNRAQKGKHVVHKDPQRTLLKVAGLGKIHNSTSHIMATYLTPVLVDFAKGTMTTETQSIAHYQAALNGQSLQKINIAQNMSFAGLKQRPHQILIYVVKDKQGNANRVVFPIEGKGYLSLLKGYLSLNLSDWSIYHLAFYQQGETPALGGHIMSDPQWLAQFEGKQVFKDGQPIFQVISKSSQSLNKYSVDGISGATHTSHSVQKMINDWMGELGYGPILAQLKARYHIK